MPMMRRSFLKGILGAAIAPTMPLRAALSSTTTLVAVDTAAAMGATAFATVTAGMITAITIINSGSGYSTTPTITISADNQVEIDAP